MPLLQSRSKKAMSKNIETEMEHGKPQKQAVAIAYAVKRKAPKKMAEGGAVSAKTEKRPMPNDTHNDKVTVTHNSSIKPSKNDSWTDNSTIEQAQRPSKTGLKNPQPLKMSKMVAANSPFNVRSRSMQDDEQNLGSRIPPETDRAQPPKRDDEERADGSGNPVSDMSKQHNNGKAPYNKAIEDQYAEDVAAANMKKTQSYANGGPVMEPEDDTIEMRERTDEAHMQSELDPSEDEGESDAMSRNEVGPNRQGPMTPDLKMKMMAEGGSIHREMMLQPQDEAEEEMHSSLAAAIMAKRRREATSMSGDPDYPVKMAEGGQVDLNLNSMEQPNGYYERNEDGVLKENYDDDMKDMEQPEDSNEIGDEREKAQGDKHDMISQIRSKMASDRRKQRR